LWEDSFYQMSLLFSCLTQEITSVQVFIKERQRVRRLSGDFVLIAD